MTVGSKWFKFDFHNHTTASDDYQDNTVTDREWLLAYMRQGVDAVIISDHNTAAKVDPLKNELLAMQRDFSTGELPDFKPLVIFPGVELTATGDVHILAIFDQDSTTTDIEQLIGQCNGGESIQRGARNHELVLQNTVTQIIGNINRNPHAISILAHIDSRKGILETTNQTELEAAFNAKPNAVEIKGELSEITDGTSRRLISQISKVRGSDAHRPDRAGTRTCWLKMSELNFDGLKIALLDHKSCVLLDSEPPQVPAMHLTKLQIKTRLCREDGGEAVLLELSPFYNAIIGSRGSGKSTLIESIRLGMRKDQDLPETISDQISSFKTVGEGMSSDSSIDCFYKKNGTDYKLSWRVGDITSLQVLSDGIWEDDTNWSNDRFNISIFSQKMLYQLASDQGSFLKVCDESTFVNKRAWNEKKERLEREYKNERIKLRGLLSEKLSESALQGELIDAERAIDQLKDSSYYGVRTTLNELESKLTQIDQKFQDENTILESVLSSFPEIQEVEQSALEVAEGQSDTETTEQEQIAPEYTSFLDQFDTIKELFKAQIVTAIETAQTSLDQLQTDQYVTTLKANILIARQQVDTEAERLRTEGLDPETLNALVLQKNRITADLLVYQDLDSKIITSESEVSRLADEMLEHRKDLTLQRNNFIESLELDGLQIKILPLNARQDQIISGYQSATDISSFNDRIYDSEAGTGILKTFIEHPTFSPRQVDIDMKYQYLDELKELHREVSANNLTNANHIHGSLRTRVSSLSDEAIDKLFCWFPDDGIQIRYRALSGNMENIETASPGQKAASMLEFLLSYGDDPLILDQPEDDLDCLMLSNSVIPAIVTNKQRRQLLIVSHSAPIVVNGDAEYVICMKHDSQGLRSNIKGALQEQTVKDNICNQMEGGETAFRSRFNRILS
ncbi:anti-phage protein Ppl [Colwellia sp. C1TZA3]|uniref:anti-phage protein Ppl n=1 Tax=Colwellia sp. C1TZA3 TaxID=2508879 RepID=UPI0011B96AC2|nr:anti-phage protein Ppl [Colwellia sp. C1TZA3]TWX74159.1 hypothetical protein ESZ39_00515 [Colwellia sp. C1TZA3]